MKLVGALLVLALVSVPARADNDDRPEIQRMRFVERGDVLTVSTTALTKLFDSAAYDALDSGVSSTVVIRIWIYPQGSNDPVAFVLVQRQVSYEPWDEIFYLNLDEPTGRKKLKEKRQADALKRLTTIEDMPVAKLAALPYDQIFLLAMQVELNPVSKETLAEVRRWLSQGTGGGLDRGGAFFGSFVSVFVNPKIAEADRVLRIRSQPFFRPRPSK
ncbi:MAG TPA: DUF4390 domain-containing protein [Kofleriaceae bacterium]|nr:DUF4390 domain-containing protein [Kofleriaceae bacterium]